MVLIILSNPAFMIYYIILFFFWIRNDQLLLTLGLCKDGDVRLEEDGTPLLFYDHKWSPICGHDFTNDNNGATTFCKKLGYGSGKATRINGRYPVANLRIGKCGAGQELISCTAGGNYLNYNILEYRYCIPTESASISIACDQKADSYSSCNPRKFHNQRLLNCAILLRDSI